MFVVIARECLAGIAWRLSRETVHPWGQLLQRPRRPAGLRAGTHVVQPRGLTNSSVKNRDIIAAEMTAEQIAEAQRLARGWDAAHPQ